MHQKNENQIIGKEEELNQLASNLAEGGIVNKLLDGNVLDNTIGEDETNPPLPPKVQASGTEGEKGYYCSEVEIQVTANDRADKLTYTVEGTGREQGSVSAETAIGNGQTIQIKKDGTYTITVFEYNRNGQKSEGSVVTIARDTQKPTVSLAVTKTEGNGITVQLVATDPEPGSGLSEDSLYTFYYQEVGTDTWIEAGKGNTSSYIYENLKENASYNLKAEVTDKAGNESSKIQTGLIIDNTPPIMTISPETNIISKNTTITVSTTDTGSGLSTDTIYSYTISPSQENPIADGYITGTYESGKPLTIGTNLNGTYYLYIQQVFDNAGNGSITNIISSDIGYYKSGPYIFDNAAPNIMSVTTSNPTDKGFTVKINASDVGSAGIASTNAYTIYYKPSGETSYKSVTTTNSSYTFNNLNPSIVTDSVNTPSLKNGMNPVIWVDLNGNGTIDIATEEIVKYTNLTNKTINSKWTANKGDALWCNYNKTEAKYDIYVTVKDAVGNLSANSNIVNAVIGNNAMDHKTSHWANVKMEDGSYFVWIPRYAYKITKAPSTKVSYTNTGAIDVKFINRTGNTAYDGTKCTIATSNINSTNQYIVHPAFCSDINMGVMEQI